jgi:hypothetical protein
VNPVISSKTSTGSIAYDAERQQTRLTMGVRDIDMAELSKLLTHLPQDAKAQHTRHGRRRDHHRQ